jgi:hypothetical protein
VADEAVRKLQAELTRSKAEADRQRKRADDEAHKRQKEVQRLKDRQVEGELRAMAKAAGFSDPDYFMHLFMRAVVADKTSQPQAMLDKMKESHPHFFTVAPPVEMKGNTAPPESQHPGEKKPDQPPAGTSAAAPKVVDVDKMTPQEFAKHTRAYGYTSGG